MIVVAWMMLLVIALQGVQVWLFIDWRNRTEQVNSRLDRHSSSIRRLGDQDKMIASIMQLQRERKTS